MAFLAKNLKKFLFYHLFICLFFSTSFSASFANAKINIEEIKFTKNTIEISAAKKSDYKIFTLKDPDRLVIDISDAKLAFDKENSKFPPFIKSFRYKESGNPLRMVFDLNQKITLEEIKYQNSANKIIAKYSGAKISNEYKTKALNKISKNSKNSKASTYKMAISKTDKTSGIASNFIEKKLAEFDSNDKKQYSLTINQGKNFGANAKSDKINDKNRKKVIVIDAGHGGKDPGAIGRYARTKEKNITLSYSRELAKQLNRTGRYKVYLTRINDVFLPLRNRVELARKKEADLFISLHANTTTNPETKGFSIYTLSEKSSDKQAERLAQKENRSDIIHGINFNATSADIMKTLIDLSQRDTKNNSAIFSQILIDNVRKSGIHILQNTHRFAGFAVLTAPDMASVLAEIGYLTNRSEEKLLNSYSYKKTVSKAIVKAIDEYFSRN